MFEIGALISLFSQLKQSRMGGRNQEKMEGCHPQRHITDPRNTRMEEMSRRKRRKRAEDRKEWTRLLREVGAQKES
jgi:hypothetical protein